MAQVRFYSESKSVVVQTNYSENQNPIPDDMLEFIDEGRKVQIRLNRGEVSLQVESMTNKKKLMSLIEKIDGINPATSKNSLIVYINYEGYLSIKRYIREHAKELPMQFEFTENNFPAQMRIGLAS